MQVSPGVFQINGAPYGAPHSGFLVHRDGATILIDSGDYGASEHLPRVERNAERWGLSFDRVSHLFVTHEHLDHASHAAALQRLGIRVVASPESADAMAAADKRCIGWAHARVVEPCAVDDVLHDNEQMTIGGLSVRCIAAPGHCDGAVIYEIVIDGEICWFVGDLLVTTGEIGVDSELADLPWTGAPDFDAAKSIETLKRLSGLRCDNLFPGHGPSAIGYARDVVGAALNCALTEWQG